MRLIDADALWMAFITDMQHFSKGGIPDYIMDWIESEIGECPAINVEKPPAHKYTLEELEQAPAQGLPCYIVTEKECSSTYGDGWFVAPYDLKDKGFKADEYDKTWSAYDREPESEEL